MNKRMTTRGFNIIDFYDANNHPCSLQQSSAIRENGPLIWLGVAEVNPQILASQAKKFGIKTSQTTGWINYPIPTDVSMTNRMHLDRDTAKELVRILQNWINTEEF